MTDFSAALGARRQAQGARPPPQAGVINPPEGDAPTAATVIASQEAAQGALFGAVRTAPSPAALGLVATPAQAQNTEEPEPWEVPHDEARAGPPAQAGDPTPMLLADPWQAATLYVGCCPVNEGAVWLDKWLAPLLEDAAKALNVGHYLFADYGKGKATVAGMLVQKLKTEKPPLVLIIDPRMPCADVALEILGPYYPRRVQKLG